MYNFSSMSGWHQLRCDQIFYPEGCSVSVRLCTLPKQRFSMHHNFQMCHPLVSVLYLSYVCCPWSWYLYVPALVTVTCWCVGAGEWHRVSVLPMGKVSTKGTYTKLKTWVYLSSLLKHCEIVRWYSKNRTEYGNTPNHCYRRLTRVV